jgi:hypothetical protein
VQGACPGYGPNNPDLYDRLTRITDRPRSVILDGLCLSLAAQSEAIAGSSDP